MIGSRPPRRRPGWFAVAVALGAGFVIGVLLVVVLAESTTTRHHRGRGGLATTVPNVVGQQLDEARKVVESGGYGVNTEGGGLFGPIVESNWRVIAEDPPAGHALAPGNTVTLSLARS